MTTMSTRTVHTETRPLRFVEPLPGFDDEDDYTLSAIDSRGLLYSMRSVRDPQLRFVLTPADAFFDDYRPELAPVVTEALGATSRDDVDVLLMLTISSGLPDATATAVWARTSSSETTSSSPSSKFVETPFASASRRPAR
jgi:flagellar assembly factor FliW